MAIRKPKAPLRVYANPFVALDAEGRPACAVAFDSGDRFVGETRRHIGARHGSLCLEKRDPVSVTRQPGPRGRATITGDGRKSRHDIWFVFSAAPQTVPDTRTHRQALDPSKGGQPALLPADEATARAVGVAYQDPSHVIVETARQALARHCRDCGGEPPEWSVRHQDLLPRPGQDAKGQDAKWSFPVPADQIHESHAAHADFLQQHRDRLSAKAPAKAPPAAQAPATGGTMPSPPIAPSFPPKPAEANQAASGASR